MQKDQLVQGMLEHPAFRPGMASLWDLRDATLDSIPSPEIHKAVETIPQYLAGRGADFAVAIVVSRLVDFGVARIYESLAAETLPTVQVLYSIDEARAWLVAQRRNQDQMNEDRAK